MKNRLLAFKSGRRKRIAMTGIVALFLLTNSVFSQTATLHSKYVEECIDKSAEIQTFGIEFTIEFSGVPPFDAKIKLEDEETGVTLFTFWQIENWSPAPDENNIYTETYSFTPRKQYPTVKKFKFTIDEFKDGSIPENMPGIQGNPDEAIIIHVHNRPHQPTFDSDLFTGCGDTITLKANPDPEETESVFSWKAEPATATFTPVDSSTVLFSGQPNVDYRVTFRQANGSCKAKQKVNAKVLGSPKGYLSTDSEVCGEGDASIAIIVGGNAPFAVNYTNGYDSFTETLTNLKTVSHPIKGETDFWITRITDSNSCEASPNGMGDTVTVADIKPVAWAGDDADVCGMGPVTLNAAPAPQGTTGTWQINSGDGTFANTSDASSTFWIHEVDGYKICNLTWTVTVNGKACETSNDVNITFYEKPEISAGADAETCGTGAVTLNATPAREGTTGTWTFKNGEAGDGEFANINDAGTTFGISEVDGHKTCILTWTVAVNDKACETSDDVNITFYEIPVADAGNDIETCGMGPVILNAAPALQGTTGRWQLNSGDGNFANINAANTAFGIGEVSDYRICNLTWTVTVDGKTCTDSDNVNITFYEIPEANAGADTIIYSSIAFLNAATPATGTGQWSSNTGISFFNSNAPRTEASGFEAGSTMLGWTVTNSHNSECASYDEVIYTLKPLHCPTGFSPNGDGINDLFEITGAHQVKNNRVTVFDKDGRVVYSQTGYGTTERPFWDGTQNGKPVPEGIYSYVFSGEGTQTVKNFLIIKR